MLVGIRLAMGSRQDQYQTIKQIECLLGLITSAMQSGSTISRDELQACDGTADVSHLTLDFPTIPAREACPVPEEGDPSCPGLEQVSGLNEFSSGFSTSTPYMLQNVRNGGYLTHANHGNGHGPIEDWPDLNSNDQQHWELTHIDGDVYKLKNVRNGGYLTHANNGNGRGPIQDRNDYGNNNLQHWELTLIDGSVYMLKNMRSNIYLTHANHGNGHGPIENWQDLNGNNQQYWTFTAVAPAQ